MTRAKLSATTTCEIVRHEGSLDVELGTMASPFSPSPKPAYFSLCHVSARRNYWCRSTEPHADLGKGIDNMQQREVAEWDVGGISFCSPLIPSRENVTWSADAINRADLSARQNTFVASAGKIVYNTYRTCTPYLLGQHRARTRKLQPDPVVNHHLAKQPPG